MTAFDTDFTLTIDGRGVAGAATIQVLNPATEQPVTQAPAASRQQLDDAVAAARRAFPAWRDAPLEQRRAGVAAIAEVIGANIEDFTRLFTLEQGRPLNKAVEELMASAFWAQSISTHDIPVVVNEDTPERRSETHRTPLGVVGAIVPWNFPMLLGVWKIASALLTGNTVVIKPSPYTPLTMLKLGELMRDRLPPGVFNVVSGADDLGPWMTAHPGIDKISFTGSSQTGRAVMASAADGLKRLTLELGGNDAAIVLADADVDAIIEPLFWSAFGNSGQVCIATKRLYVHADIYDRMAQGLADYARRMKVGNGLHEGVDLGPVQNRRQFERVRDLIVDSKAAGHKFLAGGEIPEGPGYFIKPSIVDNPPEDSRVVAEEAFGPLLPLLKFTDIDDVVARANALPLGLAGSVWSRDPDKAQAVARRLETGTVWINEALYVAPWQPFGGHKASGIGVEGGAEGLMAYTNARTITIKKVA